jgi:hypothetical protein
MSKKTYFTETVGLLTWTRFIEEIAYWYGGGKGRWPAGRDVALVFGKVLAYCDLQGTNCRASIRRIASELGTAYNTVAACLKVLKADGLIQDETPTLRNRPHRYTIGKNAAKVIRGVRSLHRANGDKYILVGTKCVENPNPLNPEGNAYIGEIRPEDGSSEVCPLTATW